MKHNLISWSNDLKHCDLLVDQIYRGGRSGNAGDDPLQHLLGVSVQGGFRILGSINEPHLVVLTTSMSDPEWPDHLDLENGLFTYYGDNKKPGNELHNTGRHGNKLLKLLFDLANSGIEGRRKVPPVLVFSSLGKPNYRDVKFLGLAVPGSRKSAAREDLVAIWKSFEGDRFQNYRARFSILDEAVLTRSWLNSIRFSQPQTGLVPRSLVTWRESGTITPLKAKRSRKIRSKDEQLPTLARHVKLLELIRHTFVDEPTRFENCAAKLTELYLGNVASIDVTQASRDGGRDAKGLYQVGQGENSIVVDFAMEAKCYGSQNSVGVKELSRLISRLRYRQFGVLITTSYVANQAYQEIIDDEHPIIIIAARDVALILDEHGLGEVSALQEWLKPFSCD